MRVLSGILGLTIFCLTFLGSVHVRDSYHEEWLKTNILQVQPGMTEREVIQILGKPTSYHMSDEPGTNWCYGSDSFNTYEAYCGKVALLMGSNNRVITIREAIL
jgi:hypothetical protein